MWTENLDDTFIVLPWKLRTDVGAAPTFVRAQAAVGHLSSRSHIASCSSACLQPVRIECSERYFPDISDLLSSRRGQDLEGPQIRKTVSTMGASASCSVTATAMASAVSNAAKLPTKGGKASNCNANQANQEQGEKAPIVKVVLWDADAEEYIIKNWGQEYIRTGKGNLKDRHWVTIAEGVNKDQGPNKQHYLPKHCKSKIDSIKKRYKREERKRKRRMPLDLSTPAGLTLQSSTKF
jgi:hypothetical protein